MSRWASCEPIFLRLSPQDIALVKFLFESYEGVAIVRTVDRRAAIIVVLVSPDFLAVARAILDDLHSASPIEEIPPPDRGRRGLAAHIARLAGTRRDRVDQSTE